MAVQTDRSEIERVNQWLMHMERDSNWLEVGKYILSYEFIYVANR